MFKVRTLLKNNVVSIEISDNGCGLPDDFDIHNTSGFGIKLILILSQQLKGKVTLKNDNGVHFQMDFKY